MILVVDGICKVKILTVQLVFIKTVYKINIIFFEVENKNVNDLVGKIFVILMKDLIIILNFSKKLLKVDYYIIVKIFLVILIIASILLVAKNQETIVKNLTVLTSSSLVKEILKIG